MMERTLLLNNGYMPVTTISWQKAICMLTLGKVQVVEEYDRDVHSTFLVIKIPAVVRLLSNFKRSKQIVKFSRHNIIARDKWKCQYCGDKVDLESMTQDHVVPRAQGGKTCWENIVTCCSICNSQKANRTPAQAGMSLMKSPSRPSWVPIFAMQLRGSAPEQWMSYIYWNTELQT
jgi:5-methylcytosine-specific restriction endonuclease McrA